MSTDSSASVLSQKTLDQFYSGMFVRSLTPPSSNSSSSPSYSMISSIDLSTKEAKIHTSQFDHKVVPLSSLRADFLPDDLILAQHPEDEQKRFFLAQIAQKTKYEALTKLNQIKLYWIAADGTKVLDFIKRHDRNEHLLTRIVPVRDWNLLCDIPTTPFALNPRIVLLGRNLDSL